MTYDPKTQTYVVYLGFTGRAAGLTALQKQTLRELLDAHDNSSCVCVHNDGEGSDQEFAAMAVEMGFRVETTPSHLKPMQRNRALVSLSSKLFAAPPTDFLLKRGSGTWETIKYMWKAGKNTFIILSDGTVVVDKGLLPKEPNPADTIGLIVRDPNNEIGRSVKEALDRGEVVVMRKP